MPTDSGQRETDRQTDRQAGMQTDSAVSQLHRLCVSLTALRCVAQLVASRFARRSGGFSQRRSVQ